MTETAGPCGCIDQTAVGCQCSLSPSDTIAVAGDGAPGSPFTPSAIIDPVSGNELSESASGLLVPTWDYIRVHASVDQNRATTDAVAFDQNRLAHGNQTMHLTSLPERYYVAIQEDGWYAMYAQVLVIDTNHLTEVNVYWEDGSNAKYSEGYQPSTPCVVSTYTEDWLQAGDHMSVHLEFTGAGPAVCQGVGGKGYRTYATMRKIAKV